MPSAIFLTHKKPDGIEQALVAIATMPTLKDAVDYLKDHGWRTNEKYLESLSRTKAERLEEVRNEVAPALEGHVANDALDIAHLTAEAERLAAQRTLELLRRGAISDPSRVLRDLSQAKAQNIEKRMTLQERPQHISEHRSVAELERALVAMGVAETIDSTAIEESDA